MSTPPDRAYLRDAAAAAEYARIVVFSYCWIWLHLIVVAAGLVPAWSLVCAAVLLSRAMTPFHEYYHHGQARYPFIIRVIPVLLSPFMGGLREQQFMHLLHHRHLGDPKQDPDHVIIHGRLPLAVLYCLVQPEHALWFWVRSGRADRQTLTDALARAALLAAAVWVLGERFLWYWVPARLLWTLNYLAFSRLLHQPGLVLPWAARALYVPLLLGQRWLPIFEEHEVHHRFPLLRAEHLRRFRPRAAAPAGGAVSPGP